MAMSFPLGELFIVQWLGNSIDGLETEKSETIGWVIMPVSVSLKL